jgi:hypothetical protein
MFFGSLFQEADRYFDLKYLETKKDRGYLMIVDLNTILQKIQMNFNNIFFFRVCISPKIANIFERELMNVGTNSGHERRCLKNMEFWNLRKKGKNLVKFYE